MNPAIELVLYFAIPVAAASAVGWAAVLLVDRARLANNTNWAIAYVVAAQLCMGLTAWLAFVVAKFLVDLL